MKESLKVISTISGFVNDEGDNVIVSVSKIRTKSLQRKENENRRGGDIKKKKRVNGPSSI